MQKAGESRSPCLTAGARGRAELFECHEGVSEDWVRERSGVTRELLDTTRKHLSPS